MTVTNEVNIMNSLDKEFLTAVASNDVIQVLSLIECDEFEEIDYKTWLKVAITLDVNKEIIDEIKNQIS